MKTKYYNTTVDELNRLMRLKEKYSGDTDILNQIEQLLLEGSSIPPTDQAGQIEFLNKALEIK